MTQQKTFKRRVRARMSKTGESYTAARRMLIASGDRPETTTARPAPPVGEAKLVAETSHDYATWFGRLDAWGKVKRSHTEMARWLVEAHEVAHWWAQTITVAYEYERGLRVPGQRADGWSAGASKTIGVPVERLFEAILEEADRAEWLPGGGLSLRTSTSPRSARFDWEDGSTRVNMYFDGASPEKSRVTVQHERLPDADTHEAMKAFWRERLTALKDALDSSG